MDNIDIGQALTYLTVIVLACFAGAVDFVNELREKWGQHTMKFILFSLFARLISAGLHDAVQNLSQDNFELRIAYNRATYFSRTDPFIDQARIALGLTNEQVDALREQ